MQIVVPVIPERLKGFQKYGVYNLKDKKVLLHCLIGTHDKKQYEQGWPKNLDVDILNHESNNAIIQIYDFLTKLKSEDIVSDWFGKIDDDTFNDLYNLINHFNKIYDSQKEFYIVPQVRHEIENCEIDVLKKIKVWENEIDYKFTHELEACWFSNKAMTNILKNEKCMDLFKQRSKVDKGYTDQCMGAAAKLCKIYPIDDYCCSVEEGELFKCSLFNGNLYHFHPICKLKNLLNYELILNIVEEDKKNKNEFVKEIINKKYFLIVKEKDEEINSIPLTFLENNILKSSNKEFKFYFIRNNDLIITRITYFIQYYVFKDFDLKKGTSTDEPYFTFELFEYK